MMQPDLFEPAPQPWRRQSLEEVEAIAREAAEAAHRHAAQWGADNPRAARMAFNAIILFGAVEIARRRQAKDKGAKR